MIDSSDTLIAIFAGLVGLLILIIVRDAGRRLTGRVRRDRTHFHTIHPKRR